ncbi:hypothetical protein OHA19_01675 [Streptomyces sp. NBC_00012]|uniref:MmyB family transcriptional regulator n=1 Tax=Streptomyces sp. NBC_00012 TaxID=2975621 RepID=UPI00324DAD5E
MGRSPRRRPPGHLRHGHPAASRPPAHPFVGDLELDQEAMSLPDESGLSVVLYSAPPNTSAEDALKLLASWSATTGQEQDTASTSKPLTRQP